MSNKNNDSKFTIKQLREQEEKKSKDYKLNTLQNLNDGISIMPHDEETLKTFSLKEMNFKDMTNSQKNTFIVCILVFLLIVVLLVLPAIGKMFGKVTIGNLRFKPLEKEEEKKDDSFAYIGDLIVIGNNTTINVENIKFYNFTKGSNYNALYNYSVSKNIDDVSNLKIYVEYYNYSKTLLRRFKFEVDGNHLSANDSGLIENQLSENTFNKAHYVSVRIISDAEMIEVPDPEEVVVDPNQNNPESGEKNTHKNDTKNKNELICTRVSVDKDVRINEKYTINFDNGKLKKYTKEYKITSITISKSNRYAKLYKKMLNKYKELIASHTTKEISISEGYNNAILVYTINLDEYYINFVFDEKNYIKMPEVLDKHYEEYENEKEYKLEIDRKSTRVTAKKELESDNWECS